MSASPLWLVNTNGNVFTISTKHRRFRQLVKTYQDGVRLKRVAACQNGAWGVGHDHHVYIFTFATEVPIRVQETTYENQRWAPIGSYTGSHLLPTDRTNWSDEHGNGYQPKESYELPSAHWTWDGEWETDDNFHGEVASRGGWQYAPNFPGKWTPESRWNSLVRKRKWIRFRRFMATNFWAKLPEEKREDGELCFIDLAVGGFDIPSQPKGHICVWALTYTGKVYVRLGVTHDCPEGTKWHLVSTDSLGLVNISVGPTGLVWGVTWDGQACVRLGVDREHVYGTSWATVTYPDSTTRIMQVALGLNTLWALSREGKVWYRKGIQGTQLLTGTQAATGITWVEMVGEMSQIAVTPTNQVFAIGLNDKEIYFRSGVTSSDLGGKTWQILTLKENTAILQQDSYSSLVSDSISESDFEDSNRFSSSGSTITAGKHLNRSGSSAAQSESSVRMGCGMTLATRIVKSSDVQEADQSADTTHSETSKPEDSSNSATQTTEEKMGEGLWMTPAHVIAQTPASVVPQEKTRQEDVEAGPTRESLHSDGSAGEEVGTKDGNISVIHQTHRSDDTHNTQSPGDTETKISEPDIPVSEHLKKEEICDITEIGNDNGSVVNTPELSGAVVEVKVTKDGDTKDSGSSDTNIEMNQSSSEKSVIDQLSPTVIQSCDTMDSIGSSITSESNDEICNFVTDLLSVTKSSVSDGTDSSIYDTKDNPDVFEDNPDVADRPKSLEVAENKTNLAKLIESPMSEGKVTPDLGESIPWITMRPSTGVSGTISASSTPSIEADVIPMFEMTPAMPRYCWAWLNGMACVFDDPAKVPWLQDKQENDGSRTGGRNTRIMLTLRDEILEKLRARNTREIENFQYIESAVQRSSWLKKGTMKWYMFERKPQWLECSLELEQGHSDTEEGTLTIQYAFKGKQRHSQICIQDIVCVKRVSDTSDRTAFVIHTPETVKSLHPWLLRPLSESDTEDWVSMLCTVNAVAWKLAQPVPVGSIWTTTMRGDIFIHPPDKLHTKGFEMCWMQHGGHLKLTETSPCGITWGIGWDHSVWTYTGGYGGGIFKATSHLSKTVNLQTDVRMVSVYENQKWYPVVGYSNRGFQTEGFSWSDKNGHRKDSKEEVQLPSLKWQWVSDWQVNYELDGGVDNNGWQYSSHYEGPFHQGQGLRDSIRRRKWSRKCRLETVGPWETCASVPLRDISVQVEPVTSSSEPVVIWAVGTNGNVLSRLGATKENPQGDSWIHVATDQPFQAVSVGGTYRVWALARDGSAWYRPGVTQYNIAGTVWLQVVPPPPVGCLLKQISVGRTAVWAVDTKGNLWHRQEITETFPEGTRWTFVANSVKYVSVGPQDQVWIVANSNFNKNKCGPGVLYRRLGISDSCFSGTSWEAIIGNGWEQVSVRGYFEPKEEVPKLPLKVPL